MAAKVGSNADRIRAFMAGKGGSDPVLASDIREALGLTQAQVDSSIKSMANLDMIQRVGKRPQPASYILLRMPAPPRTPEEAAAAERERNRRKRRQQGAIKQDEYFIKIAARKAERLKKKRDEIERRRAEREALALERAREIVQRLKRMEERAAAGKDPRKFLREQISRSASRTMAKLTPAPKVDASVEPETVEQWMARTGQQPEVLPWGATSQKFNYIGGGHAAINQATWREREELLCLT